MPAAAAVDRTGRESVPEKLTGRGPAGGDSVDPGVAGGEEYGREPPSSGATDRAAPGAVGPVDETPRSRIERRRARVPWVRRHRRTLAMLVRTLGAFTLSRAHRGHGPRIGARGQPGPGHPPLHRAVAQSPPGLDSSCRRWDHGTAAGTCFIPGARLLPFPRPKFPDRPWIGLRVLPGVAASCSGEGPTLTGLTPIVVGVALGLRVRGCGLGGPVAPGPSPPVTSRWPTGPLFCGCSSPVQWSCPWCTPRPLSSCSGRIYLLALVEAAVAGGRVCGRSGHRGPSRGPGPGGLLHVGLGGGREAGPRLGVTAGPGALAGRRGRLLLVSLELATGDVLRWYHVEKGPVGWNRLLPTTRSSCSASR